MPALDPGMDEKPPTAAALQGLTGADSAELERVFGAAADPAASGVSGGALCDRLLRRLAGRGLAASPDCKGGARPQAACRAG